MEKVVKEARTIAGFEDVPLYFESEEEIKRLDIEEAIENGRKQGLEEGIEKGIEQGIEKGVKENKKETIMNMLKDNVDLSIISKYTNTSIDQIKEIIKNI